MRNQWQVSPEYAVKDSATNFSAYTNYELSRGKFIFRPGIGYSYGGFNGKHTISPRLQVRYQLAPKTMLNLATGIYYQEPINKYIAADPANKSLRHEKSTHFIIGINQLLRNDLKFTLEGYYKSLDDLIIPATSADNILTNAGDGWSSGFDAILLKRFTDKYYGQLTYSYSVSKRNNHDSFGEYFSSYDQPHNIGFLFGYQINKELFIGAKWKYYIGRPKDRYIIHENIFDNPDKLRYSKEITGRNTDRMPNYHLLSVRIDYRKQIRRFGLIMFLELDNVYNHFNIWEQRFSELTGEEKGLGVGFLPNGGFKLEF